MSDIGTWSTTAANNNSASPDGFPEGMAPSGLNDSSREVMAAVRTQHESPSWTDQGNTPTRTGATTFTLVGDQTAQYTVGRRIKATESTPSTFYGTITTSVYTSLTTVTVSLDSGALTSNLTAIALGILDDSFLLDEDDMVSDALAAATQQSIKAYIATQIALKSIPNGAIVSWSGSIATIPSGWGICDGSTYGTTVSPNLADSFLLHADADSGGTNDVGDTGGAKTHTLTEAEMPIHNHTNAESTIRNIADTGAGLLINENLADAGSTGNTGSGDAHNNRDKYYALAYIIKHDG